MVFRTEWLSLGAAAALVMLTRADGGVVEATCGSDLTFTGGAGVTANPVLSLRSGNPGQRSRATFSTLLEPGVTITSVAFGYQYNTGYGPDGQGSNFTLVVGGETVYTSPDLTNFTYNQNRSGYSPVVAVKTTNLKIQVAPNMSHISLMFNNNDRNVQLALPLSIIIECSGSSDGTCTKSVWRPKDSPIVVYRGGEKDENGTVANCFRIPALASTANGTLLAFAEGRYASCWPDVRNGNRVVVKWSLDGPQGGSWSKARVIDYDPSCGFNYPSPIVDLQKGIVNLFYDDSRGTVWFRQSCDEGKTWSPRVNASMMIPEFRLYPAGGSAGFQLENGRLVIACGGNQFAPNGTKYTGGQRAACYSDDHGTTWKRGQNVPWGDAKNLNEASLVPDGRTPTSLTMFIRCQGPNAYLSHSIATSDDGGETWTPARIVPQVVGPTCQGSIGRDPLGPPGTVLLSAPYSTDLSLNGRENLAAWRLNVSEQGAPAAELAGRLYPCKAAYSSFSADGSLNLFEGGDTMRYQEILLAKLNSTSRDRI